MFKFPTVDPEWIANEGAKPERKHWQRTIVSITRDWLNSEGDTHTWMMAFQTVREGLVRDVWQQTIPEDFKDNARYILLGSGGRGEDLLYSDLDHAVIISGHLDIGQITSFLYSFISRMREFGFPPCEGFVMSTNPRWIGTPTQWEGRVNRYLEFPDWENARYLFMMMDGRPLYPEYTNEWYTIFAQVFEALRRSAFICWEMAHLGIYRSVALSVFGKLKRKRGQGREAFNIKEGLINPIIYSIRLLAIANGFQGTSTFERIQFLRQHRVLPYGWYERIETALCYGWRIRLENQVENLERNQPVCDLVNIENYRGCVKESLLIQLETAKQLELWTHRQFPKPR